MKLVVILARELKVWPEGVRTICQGPQGWLRDEANYPLEKQLELSSDWQTALVTHADWQAAVEALKAEQAVELKWPDGAEFMGTTKEGDPKVFYRNIGGDYEYRNENDDRWYKVKGRPHCTPLIPRPTERAVEWDGVGLPPVGSDVLAKIDFKKAPPYTVINLTEIGVDVQRAVPSFQKAKVLYASEKYVILLSRGSECMAPRPCVEFERLRTDEQIAAEEREKAINEMILLDQKGSLSRTHFCGLLYDAKYRKQSQ